MRIGGTILCDVTEPLEGRGAAEFADAFAARLGLRVVLGDPADALAHVAAEEGADLIVLGSRFAGFGGRNLRCALARELEAATPVPVVVAPPSTRKRSDRRLSAPTR